MWRRPGASETTGEHSLDRILYSTKVTTIGRFRAHVDHPRFRDSGPTQHAIFVFPRTSVVIHQEGRAPVAADPCTVTFYNEGQRYTREAIDPAGDRCEWFAVRPDVLRTVVAHFDPGAADRADPFDRSHGRSDAHTYAVQRAITRYLSTATAPDPLAVDEAVLTILTEVLTLTHGAEAAPFDRPAEGADGPKRLAAGVRAYLQDRFKETTPLDDIADAVGSSVFHLCRVFKRETGMTIHDYRQQLRLRHALDLVAERESNLTAVALELGFSSHSHFTAAFRATFDTTPSQFRRRPSVRRISELAGRLASSA